MFVLTFEGHNDRSNNSNNYSSQNDTSEFVSTEYKENTNMKYVIIVCFLIGKKLKETCIKIEITRRPLSEL